MTDLQTVRRLVAEQLDLIRRPERRRALEALLVEPRQETRAWEYGEEGDRFPYWVVAEAPERRILLAYCEEGFGPERPWGFLFTDAPSEESREGTTLGTDAQWNWYLEEAFARAGLWDGPTDRDEAWMLSPEARANQRRAAEP